MSVTPSQQLALRLGVSSQPVLSKAAEFERLLKLKLHSSNKISDSAQAIVCLDLAAERLCVQFDLEMAIKLTAVKKSMYSKYKHTIGKLLNISDSFDVNGLCVQLGCTSVRDCAIKIFKYCQNNTVEICDWTHPQFTCMAVYQACKLNKLKIPKSKFLLNSLLKSTHWNDLDVKWSKMISSSHLNIMQASKNKGEKLNINNSSGKEKSQANKSQSQACLQYESYMTWRLRILQKACEELGNVNLEKILNKIDNQLQDIVLTFKT